MLVNGQTFQFWKFQIGGHWSQDQSCITEFKVSENFPNVLTLVNRNGPGNPVTSYLHHKKPVDFAEVMHLIFAGKLRLHLNDTSLRCKCQQVINIDDHKVSQTAAVQASVMPRLGIPNRLDV